MTTPECFSCGAVTPGGLSIFGQYLCKECEARLVRSKAGKIDYPQWIDLCRRLWEKSQIKLDDCFDELN